MSDLMITAAFTQPTAIPATGLTLSDISLYLDRVDLSAGAVTVIWDGTQNPTGEVTNMGQYIRNYASADFDTYAYFARATYGGAVVLDADHVTGVSSTGAGILDAAGLLAGLVEGTLTLQEVQRIMLAFVAGETSGGNTTTVTFLSQDGVTDRIVMGVDGDGDRSAVLVDGS